MRTASTWLGKHREKLWFCIAVNLMVLAGLLLIFRPAYETNDDMGLAMFVNGAEGSFDAHLVYSNYVYGSALSLLYRFCQWIPWYVIAQYAALFCSFTAIVYVTVRRLKNRASFWIALFLVLFFGYEGYIRLQYTKTAGIVSAVGLFLILYAAAQEHIRTSELICGYVLACWGFMYRDTQFWAEAALMAGIGVFLLFALRRLPFREAGGYLRRYVGIALILLLLLAVLHWIDQRAYQSPEWQTYIRYNELRTELYDYGFPDYTENKEAYQALGISKTAYKFYKSRNNMDTEKLTIEVMEQLVALKEPRSFGRETVKGFLDKFPYSFLTIASFYCFLVILLIKIFLSGHVWEDVPTACYEFLMLGALYLYLFYQGRYLYNRVDVGIWLAVSLVVLWTCTSDREYFDNRTGLVFLFSLFCITQYSWKGKWRVNAEDTIAAKQEEKAVIETIHQDAEHLYLTNGGTISLAEAYELFDTIPYGIVENCFPMRGWTAYTPTYFSVVQKFGVSNPIRDVIGNDQIYWIDKDIELTMKYINQYYDEDAQAELVSEIGTYKVYQIKSS